MDVLEQSLKLELNFYLQSGLDMIKISHECPLDIFEHIQAVTDYDYALANVLETTPRYLNKFLEASKNGREIILDNGLFETEVPFDPDRFFYWVELLHPTWYIIPDKLEDCEFTVNSVIDWVSKYNPTSSKSIGVVQGKSTEEIVQCYKAIEPLVDKVAISFDYSFFKNPNDASIYHSYAIGRQKLLKELIENGTINQSKPHHLLGCGLASEFASYKGYEWIDSLDTSNPVVAGLKGMRYEQVSSQVWGLNDKPKEKLYTMINMEVSQEQLADIMFNITKFRDNVQ